MIDPSAQAFTEQAVQLVGVAVTFQRLTGYSPNVTMISAPVTAIVRMMIADTEEESRTGYSASQPGSISQEDRQVIVMGADLSAAGFPLPIVKGDKVIVTETGEEFDVTRVDLYKRLYAGAIELYATGPS